MLLVASVLPFVVNRSYTSSIINLHEKLKRLHFIRYLNDFAIYYPLADNFLLDLILLFNYFYEYFSSWRGVFLSRMVGISLQRAVIYIATYADLVITRR